MRRSDRRRSARSDARTPQRTRRRALGCAVFVATVVVATVVAGIVLAVSRIDRPNRPRSPASNRIVLGGSVTELRQPSVASAPTDPIAATEPADVVAIVQDYTDASHRYLSQLRVGPEGISERWRGPELPEGTLSTQVALAGDTLYVGFDNHVWALSAASGQRRWAADLSDQVTSGCEGCFAVASDRLAVRTRDAYLTAFAAGSSEPVWRRRLNAPAATSMVATGRLLVIDNSAGAPGSTVRSVDPLTGQDQGGLGPQCADAGGLNAVRLAPVDRVLAVPGTTDLVAAFGFGEGCVVRWDPDSGAVRFAVRVPALGTVDNRTTIVSSTDLVFATSASALVHVDLGTGQERTLDPGPDQTATPARFVGRTLLGWTTTTRGTARSGLAAWDLATAARSWSVALPDEAKPVSILSSDALTAGSPRAVLVADGTAPRLVTLASEKRRLSVLTLDLATGQLGAESEGRYRTRYDSGTPSVTVEVLGSSSVLVSVDNLLERIAIPSGEVSTYPG